MITPFKIKELTLQAIDLLKASYCHKSQNRFNPFAGDLATQNSLLLSQREVISICKSSRKSGALFLANVVNHLSVEKKTPSLLISSQPSLPILVANLLLWRAGIHLESVITPNLTENDFGRLAEAASNLAQAPLLVAGEMSFGAMKHMIRSALAEQKIRCLVVDNFMSESIRQWRQISCEFDLPVTIVSAKATI